jgi:hypothetical protein
VSENGTDSANCGSDLANACLTVSNARNCGLIIFGSVSAVSLPPSSNATGSGTIVCVSWAPATVQSVNLTAHLTLQNCNVFCANCLSVSVDDVTFDNTNFTVNSPFSGLVIANSVFRSTSMLVLQGASEGSVRMQLLRSVNGYFCSFQGRGEVLVLCISLFFTLFRLWIANSRLAMHPQALSRPPLLLVLIIRFSRFGVARFESDPTLLVQSKCPAPVSSFTIARGRRMFLKIVEG